MRDLNRTKRAIRLDQFENMDSIKTFHRIRATTWLFLHVRRKKQTNKQTETKKKTTTKKE